MNLFFEVFSEMDRLAPGSEASTLNALQSVREILEPMDIFEIGCGSGAQTMVLAKNTRANITALDNHAPYLRILENKALDAGLSERIQTLEGSMFEPSCPLDPYDVIWAEGCLYIMGFEKGLLQLRELLREGGVIAFSEASWLIDSPSSEPLAFWKQAYPGMCGIEENCRKAESLGYKVHDHFVLPSSDWEDEYYAQLKDRIKTMRPRFVRNRKANQLFLSLEAEMKLYQRYGCEYGYVFYILQKV
ncbi:MAG: class I SAM-dependent methyltransferase [Candidatus Cloacimonetes bacterium]|nr:class I SAM-dependent methyltransferase [Candidatus Cloacimonadota bacterium]